MQSPQAERRSEIEHRVYRAIESPQHGGGHPESTRDDAVVYVADESEDENDRSALSGAASSADPDERSGENQSRERESQRCRVSVALGARGKPFVAVAPQGRLTSHSPARRRTPAWS